MAIVYILGSQFAITYHLLLGRGICHLLWWIFFAPKRIKSPISLPLPLMDIFSRFNTCFVGKHTWVHFQVTKQNASKLLYIYKTSDILGTTNNICNMSGNRCEGVTSSIPARSNSFVQIDYEIISTVFLLPSAESFKKDCCLLQAKVCARSTG